MAFLSSSSTMDMNPSRAVTPTMTQAPHHGSNVPSEQESKDKKHEDFMKMRKVNQGMPTPYPPSDTTMPLYRPDAYGSMGYYQQQAPQGHYGTQFNHQHQQWQVSQGQHPAHLINQQEQQLTAFQPSYQQQYSKHSQMQQHQLATFIPATPNQYSGNSETFVDLNNCASTKFSTEDTQADFNDRLVKSLLEYEPVKEVIQEMCKAAVEAALSDQNYCPPSPPPPAVKMMKFVSVKPRDGPQFDWEVPEEVSDDLIRIRMDQSMIKAVLMQLHPVKDLRHMLLTGEGRKNKGSTKLPERSITLVTASMIKYIWWKGEDFLKAPYKYPNEHKDYCQDVRVLISKSLQWFKENFDADGHRLPSRQKPSEGNSEGKRTRRPFKWPRTHEDTSTSEQSTFSEPGHHDGDNSEEDNDLTSTATDLGSTALSPPASPTHQSAGFSGYFGYSGVAIPITQNSTPQFKQAAPRDPPVMSDIKVDAGYLQAKGKKNQKKTTNSSSTPSSTSAGGLSTNSTEGLLDESQIQSTMNPPKTAAPGLSHNNNNKAGSTKGPQMKDNTVQQKTKREASLGKRPATKTAVPTLASTRSKRTKAVKPQGSFSDFVGTSKGSQYDRSNDLPPHVDLLDQTELW